ncbi:MAG: hypothetical protein KAS62_12725, partial [Candidatus Delongbacteria bacterium]|nr:hypothetical protein [Candidatus Delongbacteria bacterium]
MYKMVLVSFVALFVFSCATSHNKIKMNKFMDPDTGVETIESIISFEAQGDHQTLISFNQTKN